MCLSIAIHRPNDVLAKGEHEGFEWQVIHNGAGYRCGYVRVPLGHPWHGKHYNEFEAECHGGLTFAEADLPCANAEKADDGWWIGFDCQHAWDLPDLGLPISELRRFSLEHGFFDQDSQVRTQAYVEAECRSLCKQAKAATLQPRADDASEPSDS